MKISNTRVVNSALVNVWSAYGGQPLDHLLHVCNELNTKIESKLLETFIATFKFIRVILDLLGLIIKILACVLCSFYEIQYSVL